MIQVIDVLQKVDISYWTHSLPLLCKCTAATALQTPLSSFSLEKH